ncbi:hypothetical protein [Actinomadura sp. 21ATH]|uniref:hypothetical protein n=1 Tax=Actinomadura sp. 21ATH TaxID=1735444 RepID=UPI0035C13363
MTQTAPPKKAAGPAVAKPAGARPAEVRPAEPAPGAVARFVRGRWLGTVPGRIRLHAVLALGAVGVLLLLIAATVGNARDAVRTIGHDAGPQVVATGNLYFALSDMDAHVADVLLIGREHGLGIGRDESLRQYEARRDEAGQAAIEAAQLAGQDAGRQKTVREVLQALGRYDRLVGEALLLSRQSGHAAGRTPEPVIGAYRQATDLMRMELLPRAYNLTLDSGATVRQEYEDKRGAVQAGRAWVVLAGVAALAVLVAAQLYLARTFRRAVNPALALATAGTLLLLGAAVGMLNGQLDHLRKAKEDGFDSVLTLSRIRAISHSAFADESRYLLDPERADTYEQNFLDKALAIAYVDPGESRPLNLDTYYALIGRTAAEYPSASGDTRFLGLFATEAAKADEAGAEPRLAAVLRAYARVMDGDRRMRELAAGDRRDEAIALRMRRESGGMIAEFERYDAGLVGLSGLHRQRFQDAIGAADGGLRGWGALPPAAGAVLAALILAGVRPRLAEFR